MFYCLHPEINIYQYDYEPDCSLWNFTNVSAPYWRFYWCVTDGGEITYNKKIFTLTPDVFILIPANTSFSTKAYAAFAQFYVHFSAASPFSRVRHGIYTFPISEDAKEKSRAIIKSIQDRVEDMRLKLTLFSLIYDALLHIPQKAFAEAGNRYDLRINKIIDLLDQNTSWVFSNEELAGKVNMSVNGFIRLFSTETGISPLQYSRRKRIEKACLLLHFTEQSIDEIARDTGFQDRYYFSRVFKQVTNSSPAQFRNQGKLPRSAR